MDNHTALNPKLSVVVEACAGSGKTWLLVSRILRLLLAGVAPGEILAITFTRKAAQEMQARLHEWLHDLAVEDDAKVRAFLVERELHEVDDALLARARGLYRDFMLAQPSITINTFHGWFMQIIQRAPLNAGVPVGMQLLERTSALHEEAWQALADNLRAAPDGETAQAMQQLFGKYGLHSTRALLENFIAKRAEWWAYTQGQQDALTWVMGRLQNELDVHDMEFDPVADWGMCGYSEEMLFAFVVQLAANGTEPQKEKASALEQAWTDTEPEQRFAKLWPLLFTQKNEPRIGSPFKSTAKQNADIFLHTRNALQASLQETQDELTELEALRMNRAALHCGAALLEHYQALKLRQQMMDFTDVEWQVCRLLNQSDGAEYMQYKLDSRYRHVLLDEFQDTNPLQWQILQAWFAAAAAVESRPTVFVVGDPKQSIYRFRRADARLFGVVREFLQQEFGAHHLTQNETRRNAPAVLQAVNGVFSALPDGLMDFETHIAHHQSLPGHVELLPLLPPPPGEDRGEEASDELHLRNPLLQAREEQQSGVRELEAKQFAAHIAEIVAHWQVQDADGTTRRAEYRDIMVLVRKRTHLRVYEHALRARHIPFLTSRRGGLLDTLEAEDIQALLTFLITPFADLELAQALRSPVFSCSDADLMSIAEFRSEERGLRIEDQEPGAAGFSQSSILNPRSSWWSRLQQLNYPSPTLQRAQRLLKSWLALADKLPVHDLLDRIYFEGDLAHRYAAALPAELHETVRANLQAFMEIALNVDAGRYPSLPRFLGELRELRAAENEAPDEGRVGEVGNALRIYTVHESKGLEAPIVWLLDANDTQQKTDSYGVLVDWQPSAPQPAHFSLYTDKRGRGVQRAHYFEADEEYAKREEMNLLYVAMTRARQALLVSGNGELAETSWYGRIAAVAEQGDNPLLCNDTQITPPLIMGGREGGVHAHPVAEISALQQALPTGKYAARATSEQLHGIRLHALLQYMTQPHIQADRDELEIKCGIPAGEMESLWQQAQYLIALPHLQRFFDARQHRAAYNEMPYANACGELKRMDRLVEFDSEVWVLDYKTGSKSDVAPYRAQMAEYRNAMQSVYAGKQVRCALLFADGTLHEME